MRSRLTVALAATLLLLTACGPGGGPRPTADAPVQVTLMSHDSFAVSDDVLAALEAEHGITLNILRAGDAGEMVNQAILAKDAPLADVLYGVDNAFLSRALAAGIFEPYTSPLLADVPVGLQLDPERRVTPIDYGDVCINYERAAFDAALPAAAVPPPTGLADLTDPRYAGMLVVENPATSSPGLAFVLATIAHFGEGDGIGGAYDWRDYWTDLAANDVLVAAGWEEAYYGHFSAASDGDRPIVVSYATSPVAEFLFADPPVEVPPTASLTEGCFRQIEFAGVLAGTPRQAAAQEVIDFLLDRRFQEDVPLNMYVFPANAAAQLPDAFVEHAAHVAAPLTLDPAEIAANRERWIDEWTEIVLR